MNDTFSTPKEWSADATRKETFEHFGYEYEREPKHGVGRWANDGEAIMRNIRALPEILEQFTDPKEKIRIIFDYDPNFPRALFQIWGLQKHDGGMSSDEGKSSSVVQNTSIASSPVGPMIISVIKARLSICSYAASLSAGVRLRRSTLYILLTVSPPFKEDCTSQKPS